MFCVTVYIKRENVLVNTKVNNDRNVAMPLNYCNEQGVSFVTLQVIETQAYMQVLL